MTGAASTVQLAMLPELDAPFSRAGKIAVVGAEARSVLLAATLARASLAGALHGEPAVVLVRPRRPRASYAALSLIGSRGAARNAKHGAPHVAELVDEALRTGLLRESWLLEEVRDADAIVLCADTGWTGVQLDYTELLGALHGTIAMLRDKPDAHVPLVVFDGLLAPSSMATVIHDRFAANRMRDGEHVSLGNVPPRTGTCSTLSGESPMRIEEAHLMVAGTAPATPALVERLYAGIVTRGTLLRANSLTAEVTSCAECAYRDVRIALAAEMARYADEQNIDFFAARKVVNERLGAPDVPWCDARVTPTGALLVPTVGVGGRKLPIAAHLLRWRESEAGDTGGDSVMLKARRVNDASPAALILLAERTLGRMDGRRVTLLGAAYRPDVADTARSPALALAAALSARGCTVRIHDPYVSATDEGVRALDVERGAHFTNHLATALADAETVILCTAHSAYAEMGPAEIQKLARVATGLVDGCNLYARGSFANGALAYTGTGRGTRYPDADFLDFAVEVFRAVERGFANELRRTIDFLNERFAEDDFNRVSFHKVQQLARSNPLGYRIPDYGAALPIAPYRGYRPSLCL